MATPKVLQLGNGDVLRLDAADGQTFPGTDNKLPSMTRQSDTDSCDINKLVKQYTVSGNFPMPTAEPLFLDVTRFGDFRQVMDHINQSTELFLQLDPKTRARFNNDPAQFLDYTSDPRNVDQLVELGLITAEDLPEVRKAMGLPESPPAPPQTDTPPKEG